MDQSIKYAFAGDQVALMLQGVDPLISLSPGDIICDPDHLVSVTNRIRARLLIFSPSQPITKGYPVIFYHHCSSVSANITRLISANVKEGTTRKDVFKPRQAFQMPSLLYGLPYGTYPNSHQLFILSYLMWALLWLNCNEHGSGSSSNHNLRLLRPCRPNDDLE